MTTSPLPLVVLPDSPDVRLLTDLTSHASDLSEAAHSLECAFAAGEGSQLWLPLTSHAVSAYIRPFIISNVRQRLDEIPGIPPIPTGLHGVHNLIRKYRNTTIAHSQSTLSMPLPVAFLDAEGRAIKAAGVSIIQPMPLSVAERFVELIAAMEDTVETATQPVLERLGIWLKEQTREIINGWEFPEFLRAADSDFTASQRRLRTPRFTSYWRSQQHSSEEPHEY